MPRDESGTPVENSTSSVVEIVRKEISAAIAEADEEIRALDRECSAASLGGTSAETFTLD